MYYIILGVISPFILIGVTGDEINKTQRTSGIVILVFLYLLGLLFF